MQAVFISPNSWHYKIQEKVFGTVPYRYHFCPYFWLAMFAVMVFPFVIPIRGIFRMLGRLFDAASQKVMQRRQITIDQWIKENLADHYSAFRFYMFYVSARRVDYFFVPRKKNFPYEQIWIAYTESPEYEKYPFSSDSIFDYEYSSEARLLRAEFQMRLDEEYETLFKEPALKLRELNKTREAKREEKFSLVAQYTKIPFYFLMFLAALVVTLFVGEALGFLAAAIYINSHFIGQVSVMVMIIMFFIFAFITSIISDDDFYHSGSMIVVIFTHPRRIVRKLFGTIINRFALPFFVKIGNAFSIFGTFLETLYEGSCPNMIIEGDDVDKNSRL